MWGNARLFVGKENMDIQPKKTTPIEEMPIKFDPEQIKQAISSLEKYIPLMQNNNRLFETGINTSVTGKYFDYSLKRSSLISSKVEDAAFINTAFTGSYFSEVNYSNTEFDESNMQYCQYIHNKMQHIDIHSSNLSYSNFFNTTFTYTNFRGSTISEILFEECTFKECLFTASMLENTIFMKCTFCNVVFENTNVEYMEFKNCTFDNVSLPMAQVPYIFGLFQSMEISGNNIKLLADEKTISLEEYKTLKDALIIYYTSISEYFPLVNIYLAGRAFDIAYDYISLGIKKAIIQRNFRMLKFFCKQAKQKNVFPYNRLKELYVKIEKYSAEQKFNMYEQRSFIYNIGEIRSILLDNMDDFPTARIALQTNIDSSESEKIIKAIEYIDMAINESCTQKISHIEYHHNSDANFIIQLSARYIEILFLVNTLLMFSDKVIDSVQKKIINHQQIVLNNLEIEDKKKKTKEIESKSQELQKNNIHYTVQYIINNPTADFHDINLYL